MKDDCCSFSVSSPAAQLSESSVMSDAFFFLTKCSRSRLSNLVRLKFFLLFTIASSVERYLALVPFYENLYFYYSFTVVDFVNPNVESLLENNILSSVSRFWFCLTSGGYILINFCTSLSPFLFVTPLWCLCSLVFRISALSPSILLFKFASL